MLFAKTYVVIAVLASLSSLAACGSTQETNAQRMARGLPPMTPKFGRTVPGRKGEPTPAWAAKRTTPSYHPPTSYSGRVMVRNEEGKPLGFIKNTNSSSPIGGLNLGAYEDLHIKFTTSISNRRPFDIVVTNPLFDEPFFVGAAHSFDLTNKSALAFTNVQQTRPQSTPVNSTYDDNMMVESSIWSFNWKTTELTAQYVNEDKSKPTTAIAYDTRENKIFFTFNITAYNENNGDPASHIRLFLV